MVLGIYGAGGFGREVRETAIHLNKWDEIIYIDDFNNADYLDGSRRLSFDIFSHFFSPSDARIVCALGDPKKKKEVCNRVEHKGYDFDNVIHPNSEISNSAMLGKGIIIRSGVIISVGVSLYDNCAIMENTYIGHGTEIGNGVHISPNVSIGGNVVIEDEVFIGSNACIKEKLTIGKQCIIGLGAIVINDVSPQTIFYNKLSNVTRSNDLSSIF